MLSEKVMGKNFTAPFRQQAKTRGSLRSSQVLHLVKRIQSSDCLMHIKGYIQIYFSVQSSAEVFPTYKFKNYLHSFKKIFRTLPNIIISMYKNNIFSL